MQKLLAFHGEQAIKDKYVERVKAHQKADEIIQGIYWYNGKGCAVGCTIEKVDSPHQYYETELGIPQAIAHLEDRIFEGLTNAEAKTFPLRFLEAIKPGADLSLVVPKFMVWLMTENEQYAKDFPKTMEALKTVRTLYQRVVDGGEVAEEEWPFATYTAWSAANAASSYANANAAWSAAYTRLADKLIELLAEAQ